MKFQVSTLAALGFLSAVKATTKDSVSKENGLNENQGSSGLSTDGSQDSFVPRRILRTRRDDEGAHVGRILKNPESHTNERRNAADHVLNDLGEDLGILNEALSESRHLQDAIVPAPIAPIDCETYCSGERPIIGSNNGTKFFQTFVDEYFDGSSPYNGPISCWDTSGVTDMTYAFNNRESFILDSPRTQFNKDLSCWDTSNVTSMSRMFRKSSSFNSPIDSWDISSVTNTFEMFKDAVSFNQCLSTWPGKAQASILNGDTFTGSGCPNQSTDFDPKLGPWCQGEDICTPNPKFFKWDPSVDCNAYCNQFGLRPVVEEDLEGVPELGFVGGKGVTNGFQGRVYAFLTGRSDYNVPMNCWDTSKITNMASAFYVDNCNYMSRYAGLRNICTFKRPLGCWNVSAVTDMSEMFQYRSSLDQCLLDWKLQNPVAVAGDRSVEQFTEFPFCGSEACSDSRKFRRGKSKLNCKKFLRKGDLKKKCNQRYKGKKVFDFCAESCAQVDLGECASNRVKDCKAVDDETFSNFKQNCDEYTKKNPKWRCKRSFRPRGPDGKFDNSLPKKPVYEACPKSCGARAGMGECTRKFPSVFN